MSGQILLELKNISRSVHGLAGSSVRLLDNISLKLSGEEKIISFLGASSNELTSLLKIISAVEKPSGGEVLLNGSVYSHPAGRIVYIPSQPSSFPWLNVKQNVEFGLKQAISSQENDKKVKDAISLAGLEGYEDHFPDNGSTGFRFRISFARAAAAGPEIILLDEPLNALHGETKREIFSMIKNAGQQANINIIIATTNISDALLLSDKILLMKRHPGRLAETIDIDKSKTMDIHSDYYHSLKTEIDKLLLSYENVPLK